jgi:C-terminal processing protease CtpA/Prc
MAAALADADAMRNLNVRLCRLRAWSNYENLGFSIESASTPLHIIRTVESNSPATASGLKILDVVLAVNDEDVSQCTHNDVINAIKNARAANNSIELLVVEQRFYSQFKRRNVLIDPTLARVIESPARMPLEYENFPENTPRTCEIRLKKTDAVSFGFEIVNGPDDIGMQIQEVAPDSQAGKTSLRKSDRVLEIDDTFIDNDSSRSILEKFAKAKIKGSMKLYVVDTNTYQYFKENEIPLSSKEFQRSSFAKQLSTKSSHTSPDSK